MNRLTTGLIAGLALGFLFAPKKGDETREDLICFWDKAKDRFDRMFGKGEEELNSLKELLEDSTQEITSEAREQLLKMVRETQRKYRFIETGIEEA